MMPTNVLVAQRLEEDSAVPLEISMAILEHKPLPEIAELFKSHIGDLTSEDRLYAAEFYRKLAEIMHTSAACFELLAQEENHENQD